MTDKRSPVVDRKQWVLSALEAHEGRLLRYADRLLGDSHAARDAVQHAFLRLCDQDPDRLNSRLEAWLYTVCRNKAYDLIRARGRSESLNGHHASQLAEQDLDPARLAERSDLQQELLRLVDQLSTSQREIVTLWMDGFSYREMAAITARSEGHLRVALCRALGRLRATCQARDWLPSSDCVKTSHNFHERNHE